MLNEELVGAEGEALYIDAVVFGDRNPTHLYVHQSGVHGVEGYAGSAIQTKVVTDVLSRNGISVKKGCALLFLHAVNPYGMSHYRRVNESNVDLNRNLLLDFDATSPPSIKRGDRLYNLLIPTSVGFFFRLMFWPRALVLVIRVGLDEMKKRIGRGHHSYPEAPFYGGNKTEDSALVVRKFLKRRFGSLEKVVLIDVHTGLGPKGYDSVLVRVGPPVDYVSKMVAPHPVQLIRQSESDDCSTGAVPYVITGLFASLFGEFCETIYVVGQEFGTVNSISVLEALIEENFYHQRKMTGKPMGLMESWLFRRAKNRLLEIFYVQSDDWKEKVLTRGETVFRQLFAESLDGLEP